MGLCTSLPSTPDSGMPSRPAETCKAKQSSSPKHTGASSKGITGLPNLGNTCYLNSTLQLLLSAPGLTDYYLATSWESELNSTNFLATQAMATSYASLVSAAYGLGGRKSGGGGPVGGAARKVKSGLGKVNADFAGTLQHDAQECLLYLLDGMHEDLNRVTGPKPYVPDLEIVDGEVDGRGVEEREGGRKAWENHLMRERSAVVDLFQGQLKCTLTCASCGSKRVKFEPFLCLTLPMGRGMDEMLEAFEKEEILDGDCEVKCEKCKGRRPHRKKMELWVLPPVLLISVKRFDGRQKLRGRVEYPVAGLDFEKKARGSRDDRASYDLFGVVRHHGTRDSGHYTALCKSRFGAWWLCDDSRVSKYKGDVVDDDAYVVGYCRMVGGEREHARRQSVSLPELWPGGR